MCSSFSTTRTCACVRLQDDDYFRLKKEIWYGMHKLYMDFRALQIAYITSCIDH